VNPATARQLEVHAFMLAYQREHVAPPTVREIADHFNLSSTNGVADHLAKLEKKGLVRHRAGYSRGWIALEVRS
jgi:repressor LexA